MEWLKLYKSTPTRKPSTYASYLATYETHFADAFGEMPLYKVTQDVVQDYYQKKQLTGTRKDGKSSGLSPKTIRNHHMILKDFSPMPRGSTSFTAIPPFALPVRRSSSGRCGCSPPMRWRSSSGRS